MQDWATHLASAPLPRLLTPWESPTLITAQSSCRTQHRGASFSRKLSWISPSSQTPLVSTWTI